MPKRKLMENCPLCEMIQSGPISQGDHCCVLMWGNRKTAVMSTHTEYADAEATIEALKLLKFDQGKHILREFDIGAGHWGIEAVPAGEIASIGKSIVRSS